MRLIDADALQETIKNYCSGSNTVKQRQVENTMLHEVFPQIIDDEPTIDHTNLVLTAKWEKCDYKTLEHGFIETNYDKGIYCTNCRYGFKNAELKMRNYCPNCGARMDGDENEKEKED